MWGADDVDFAGPEQGQLGNCYILAAMGAVAEYPDLIKSVFLTQEKNDAGIYALQFYIRGKPWIITIDDTILRYSDGSNYFSKIEDNLWIPLLEKGWAKVKGSYTHTDGGWAQNGIRAFTGAPVFEYWVKDLEETDTMADDLFELMKAANDLDYILGGGTDG